MDEVMTMIARKSINTGRVLVGLVALVLALTPALTAVAGDYPAIGKLPAWKGQDAARVALGKRLFFDARLSGDGAISCAVCHKPSEGFTSRDSLSKAYPGSQYFRNAPTLLNTAYKADFVSAGWAWEGRIGADMNDVMRDQLTETTIMNMDMRIMSERVKQDPEYVKLCERAGGWCSNGMVRKALAAFVETLVSNNTPFDQGKLSKAAKKGEKLFTGKAGCIKCHSGAYFSDGRPHNTGVPEALEIFTNPVKHATLRAVLTTYGVPKEAQWRRDVGYFLVSKRYGDVGKFITPTLRELKYTAPYMHNGTIGTLSGVVEFYSGGGGHDDPLPNELKVLDLSSAEQKELVAFLESLSSSEMPFGEMSVKVSQEYPFMENWLDVKSIYNKPVK